MQISSFLETAKNLVEEKLQELIQERPELPFASLFSSARYSLLSPAKRMRPLLLLAVVQTYAHSLQSALIPACALELIHTYSLIHDDLPCMDNDDLRRGKPTLHKVVPEWQALLTGDYLLTHAFELLAHTPSLTSDQQIALVRSMSKAAGAHGMIGGQMIDLLSQDKIIDLKTLEQMHLLKTGALIIAALECGGILAQVPKEDLHHLITAGRYIGLTFQVIDDVLDYTSTENALGKPIGSDLSNKKATAVSLLGIEVATQWGNSLLQTALEHLHSLSRPAPLIEALFMHMTHRNK